MTDSQPLVVDNPLNLQNRVSVDEFLLQPVFLFPCKRQYDPILASDQNYSLNKADFIDKDEDLLLSTVLNLG